MGSVKSEVHSQFDTSSILSEEVIYFVPEHYDPLAYAILRTKAEELGAQIAEYADATIIIVNENSPLWDEEAKAALLDDVRTSDPVILPYHWLSACLHRQRRVTVDDLDVPFMVQPLSEHFPLKVWVSKNVQRDVNEEADVAYKKVVRQLESVGALSVVKRAHADVLVVDMASNFFQTVKKEKEENRRDWQKLAQRDWVDFCIANGTLQLTTHKEEEGAPAGSETEGAEEVAVDQNGDEVDSMMDEGSPVRAGPGRPTGKPRVEYTPEDDDFLCRYLAYNYPDGSWGSRKTYQELVSDQLEYPLAARHTSQSWHERFKKNSAAFGRRVSRFMNEKVDRLLKTAPERAATAAKQAQREAEAQRAATRTGSTEGVTPVASTSRQAEAAPPSILVPETLPSAQPSGRPQAPPDRTLVTADSPSPPPERPANVIDPKGKGRETEPIAGPSRHSEAVVQQTQAESGNSSKGNTRPADGTQVARSDRAEGSAPPATSAVVNELALPAEVTSAMVTQDPETTAQALPKKKRKRVSAIDNPAESATAVRRDSSSRRYETPVNNVENRIPQGSTPLRQEIERSNEKRRREQHRKAHGHGPASRRLSKRASSPDKVYAFVNLPPPRPVVVPVQETTPEPPGRRTPPRELTPAERQQSVLAGSRIVQDIAAQYRLRVAALGKKFGVGIKEISAATNEVKRRNGGNSAVDWNMLETVLQEQYGR